MGSISDLLFNTTGTIACIFKENGDIECSEVSVKTEKSSSCGWLQAPGFGKLRQVTAHSEFDQAPPCRHLLKTFIFIMQNEVAKYPEKLDKFKHPDENHAHTVMNVGEQFEDKLTRTRLNFTSSAAYGFELMQSWYDDPTLIKCTAFSIGSKKRVIEVYKQAGAPLKCKELESFTLAILRESNKGPSTVFPKTSSKREYDKTFFPMFRFEK